MAAELTIGDFIRQKRESLGVAKRALSLDAGVSQSYVSKVELGQLEPSLKAFAGIARALNLSDGEIALLVRREAGRG